MGKSVSLLWEQIIVAFAVTILLCTRRRGWARLLFTYCVFGGLVFALTIGWQPSPGAQRFAIARATLYFIAAWLIARWLRRQRVVEANVETARDVNP